MTCDAQIHQPGQDAMVMQANQATQGAYSAHSVPVFEDWGERVGTFNAVSSTWVIIVPIRKRRRFRFLSLFRSRGV